MIRTFLVALVLVGCTESDPTPVPAISGLYQVHRTEIYGHYGPALAWPTDYELAISDGMVTMITTPTRDALEVAREDNHLVFHIVETWTSPAGNVITPHVDYELDATIDGGLTGRASGIAEIVTGPLYTPPTVIDLTFDVSAIHE